MRRRLVLPTCLIACLIGALSADADAKTPRRCPNSARHIVVANAQAMIYLALESHGLLEYVACAHGHRVYRIGPEATGSSQGGGGISLLRIAGTMVAYEDSAVSFDVNGIAEPGSRSELVVRNLATGHVIHRIGESFGVTALVLKRDGAIGWLEQTAGAEGSPYSVTVADTSGRRVVGTAPAAAREALGLSGNTLYWTNGARAESTEIR